LTDPGRAVLAAEARRPEARSPDARRKRVFGTPARDERHTSVPRSARLRPRRPVDRAAGAGAAAHLLESDGIHGLADACVDARAHRGRVALVATGVSELGSLAAVVLAARVGRRVPISRGFAARPHSRRTAPMRHLTHDLKQAWRSLVATPGTVVLATFTLALGLGVNVAVFSILDSLLFRPVPYAEADRPSRSGATTLAEPSDRRPFDAPPSSSGKHRSLRSSRRTRRGQSHFRDRQHSPSAP
jgi:hypothetical protein